MFANRNDAGAKLAAELMPYSSSKTVVLAIPNGGVPLAMKIADSLNAGLDIIVCRKLALPMNPEGGLGAVAEDGTSILNEDVIKRDGISSEQIEYEINQIKSNIKQRNQMYKGENISTRLTGKTAIIVDDGLASGITMTVAVESIRHRFPEQIIVAVPVASTTGYNRAIKVADKVVALAVATMAKFYLADFYRSWRDITDNEVVHSLEQWRSRRGRF